jgi:hypothetical protein
MRRRGLRRRVAPGNQRRTGALIAAVALGATLAVTSPGTAAFAGGNNPGGVLPAPTPSAVAIVHRCVLYANTSGFGADCAGGSSDVTVKVVLQGDPFPECRFDPLPSDVSPPDTHDGEKGAWFLKTCLKGIKADGTGDFTRTTDLEWFPDGKDVPVLTTNQGRAWSFFRSTYPAPIPQFGPATEPRVLIPTYFWLTDSTGADIDHTVFDGTRDVLMRARVEQIEITPGRYQDEKPFLCPGPVPPYDRSRSIFNQANTCSYDYDRSSAISPDKKFDVTVQADWVVEYQLADGSMKLLGRFPLSNVFETPVDEIQTVVG